MAWILNFEGIQDMMIVNLALELKVIQKTILSLKNIPFNFEGFQPNG